MRLILSLIFISSIARAAEPYATFDSPMISESSGLVKSRQYPDTYWTHNDSGDDPRIFAVRVDGTLIIPEWAEEFYEGVRIADAVNIDWESVAVDDQGRIAIGAFGNNGNARQDLALYLVTEPNPQAVIATRALSQIRFRYPDQDAFPPELRNYDAEALFFADGKFYIISKNRSAGPARLYRFDSMDPIGINTLTLAETFEFDDKVTGADYSPELRTLAVLTYASIWIFPRTEAGFFASEPLKIPLENTKQCEAICFDGDTLIVTNEQTELFRFAVRSR